MMKNFVFFTNPTNPELDSIHPHSINQKANFLRSYFDKIEKTFKEESDSLWKECELENKRTKNHEDDSEHDYRPNDALQEIEFIYLRMHRYSAVLASYAYIESSMLKICNELEHKNSAAAPLTKTSGNGIEKYKKYLTSITGMDFNKINSAWSQIMILNKIRNCIIHADGDASRMSSSQHLIRLIEKNKNISFIENNLIMISPSFIHDSIESIKNALLHMYKEINSAPKNQNVFSNISSGVNA